MICRPSFVRRSPGGMRAPIPGRSRREKKTCLLHEKTLIVLFAAEVVELVDTLS